MWSLFLKAFGLVFLAEMGDKTQLSALALAASADGAGASRAHPQWAVFLGSALALALTSALAAFCGAWIARHVDPRRVKVASALLFFLFGALLLRDAWAAGGGAAP